MFVDLQQDWATRVATDLVARGIARFDRVYSREQFVTLGASLGQIVPHRDSESDGVTALAHQVDMEHRAGFAGFGTAALAPHTDRSGVADPPALLLVVCARKSTTGGECVVIDGCEVYADLLMNNPAAADAFLRSRTVLFGGAAGYLGSVFEHAPGGRIRIRYRADSLADFAPALIPWLPLLREAIQRHTTCFALEPGQGYALHNHRWLHGRSAFTGDRLFYRLSLSPHPEFEIPAGFSIPGTSYQSSPGLVSGAGAVSG
ncbi:TauD/TfdA family dioxygenase [Nocardia sp. NPDC057353]|uniref:TauD/TfdA family dioxygenase n=1 Tax=Nocardia sp. NPDC057353 TaxID=3346104 RepID=UPI00364432BF